MASIELQGLLHHYDYRPGPRGTVVLSNGIMSPLESWDGLVEPLQRLGYGVLRWEYRGQWRTARSSAPFGFADIAADLAALLDALQIEQAHLCGTSYGGFVSMRFAVDYPARTRSLLALTTAACFTPVARRIVRNWHDFAAAGDVAAMYSGMAPDLFSPRVLSEAAALINTRGEGMVRATAALPDFMPGQHDLYKANFREFAEQGLVPELPRIQCPTTVVSGELDRLYPPECSRLIAEHVPGAEHLVVAEAGHALVFEQPHTVTMLLAGHLARAEAYRP
ncbi:alpha/beta fold hydrolase [Alkalilimnicola sp. S0819]|uniref:alpha/beta fold hydrolase n=1 Tax=Alkalilimnicola sp. S0819 TaxID=2613922 RepID=UPI0012617A6B|nr:alpha/beta fold hydrolase [Alkalilimnicola sp. S0819]KAB7619683.1 alpha/beta fold hydrolase [Alkalilimnicola sp. S0819]MPQ17540.1 alpha/beta fold hydrolase [Alkalilimnicola sp. S0819]